MLCHPYRKSHPPTGSPAHLCRGFLQSFGQCSAPWPRGQHQGGVGEGAWPKGRGFCTGADGAVQPEMGSPPPQLYRKCHQKWVPLRTDSPNYLVPPTAGSPPPPTHIIVGPALYGVPRCCGASHQLGPPGTEIHPHGFHSLISLHPISLTTAWNHPSHWTPPHLSRDPPACHVTPRLVT